MNYRLISSRCDERFKTLSECVEYMNKNQIDRFSLYQRMDYGWELVVSQ